MKIEQRRKICEGKESASGIRSTEWRREEELPINFKYKLYTNRKPVRLWGNACDRTSSKARLNERTKGEAKRRKSWAEP
ncbi:hypothetical protein FACS1894219_02650 [Clostridia bacterium]|nr:hypothetical protein FACS1894219_02650 [Clostridia bacterium]